MTGREPTTPTPVRGIRIGECLVCRRAFTPDYEREMGLSICADCKFRESIEGRSSVDNNPPVFIWFLFCGLAAVFGYWLHDFLPVLARGICG